MKLLTLQFPSASSYFPPFTSKYPPQYLFSNTLGLNSSLNITDQVEHQHLAAAKIVVSQDVVNLQLQI